MDAAETLPPKESRNPNSDPGEVAMSWQDAPGRKRTGAGAASWGVACIPVSLMCLSVELHVVLCLADVVTEEL